MPNKPLINEWFDYSNPLEYVSEKHTAEKTESPIEREIAHDLL